MARAKSAGTRARSAIGQEQPVATLGSGRCGETTCLESVMAPNTGSQFGHSHRKAKIGGCLSSNTHVSSSRLLQL